tara:strand:+ start:3993 stop:4769 length:777 start_codon:yes stop_codon:yes gene_type:complete
VSIRVIINKYPINAVLKNGTSVTLNGRFEVASIAVGFDNYTINDEILVIKNKLGTIKLLHGAQNGDPIGVFFEEVYKMFPAKDQTIIDVGANIGDSSIYFALKGAKKIIAIEPFPANYELAKKNIELNNLQKIIDIDLAGCSNKSGFLTVDNKKSGGGASLTSSITGTKIPLFSLENILKQNNLDSAILKMDCEGCEYDSILKTDNEIMRKFSTIIIEYHYGYQNLVEKLESCGFQVEKTSPMYYSHYHIGYIYATIN